MENNSSFVITISRQLGSGGAYIGQELAKKLNFLYADREIISKVAQQFSVLEEDLELRDEKIASFWESLLPLCAFGASDVYAPPQVILPSDRELYKAEAEVIKHIAKEGAAVIIGRCSSYILRDHPNHVSIFLHGDPEFRKNRIKELYNLSEKTAQKMIAQNDEERGRHYHKLTGRVWTDVNHYDIALDTSRIGFDKSVELIMEYLQLAEKGC